MLFLFCLFFCRLLLLFFSKFTFSKKSFRNTTRVQNSSYPDEVPHFVRPDLGPICLQRLSADNRQVKIQKTFFFIFNT